MVIDFLGSWITWFCACPAPAINMNDENASILALFIGHKMVFVLNKIITVCIRFICLLIKELCDSFFVLHL